MPYIHKINGTKDKTSLNVVLPRKILLDLKIGKGDFVEINRENELIVIKGLRVK
jgi:antitoxin component of MazEF toxin-antitoxin module